MLAGCADQNYAVGKANFDAGYYPAACDRFRDCVNSTKSPVCMTALGGSYASMGDFKSAVYWQTLAARYGEPTAISNLTKAHLPVPDADLARQTDQEPGFLTYLLLGAAANKLGSSPATSSYPSAQVRDSINVNPNVGIDRSVGQVGGGVKQ